MEKRVKYFKKVNSINSSIWTRIKPKLSRLDIELTERCNNSCIHCGINLPKNDEAAKSKELSTYEFKRILKEAAVLGCFQVRFTGGEPLLRDDFSELYLYARKLGLKVLIFTNATLIDQEIIQMLIKYPPGIEIEVSVYGMTQKTYESVSQNKGSFNAAFNGMNLLLKNNIPFVVKSAILPQNRDEIDEFERWAATIPWMTRPPKFSMFFHLRARGDIKNKKNTNIKNLRLTPKEGLKVLSRRPDIFKKDMQEFCIKFLSPPSDELFSCGAGMAGGTVDAYGNFQLCMMLRDPNLVYDLRRGSIEDALENFFPNVRMIKAKNREYLLKCARCFLRGLCDQCPAHSWIENRNLDTPVDYLCEIAHEQARYLGLIHSHEKAWEVKDWENRLKIFELKSNN